MDEATYTHCVDTMRLKDSGLLFGLPIVLDTNDEARAAAAMASPRGIALTDRG